MYITINDKCYENKEKLISKRIGQYSRIREYKLVKRIQTDNVKKKRKHNQNIKGPHT